MTTDDIKAALAPFGATLSESGFIAKGENVTGVRPLVSGRRLRFETDAGHLLASGRMSEQFVAEFVSRFWFWKKV